MILLQILINMEKIKGNFKINDKELNKYRDECYKEILKDEEFLSLILKDFNEEEIYLNVSKFHRYLKDYNAIKELKTYEDCVLKNKFFYYVVYKDGSLIKEKEKEVPAYHDFIYYVNQFKYIDFDYEKYYKLVLNDIPRKELVKQIKDRAKGKLNLFYIYGASGTFKTLSAISMCNGYIKNKGLKISFMNSFRRIKELNDLSFNKLKKEEYNEMLNDFLNSEVLVLDGFGEEYKTSYSRDSFIIPILKERIKNDKLITIITSNYSPSEIASLYKLKDNFDTQSNLIRDTLLKGCKAPIYSGDFSI